MNPESLWYSRYVNTLREAAKKTDNKEFSKWFNSVADDLASHRSVRALAEVMACANNLMK